MHVISPVDILLIISELCNSTASASGANNFLSVMDKKNSAARYRSGIATSTSREGLST
jgi:hypothetical protein